MAIEFYGIDGILERLDSLVDTQNAMQSMGRACALVERAAKQNASQFKDTGALQRSIASDVKENGGEVEGVIYTPLEYAPYVEFGTGLFAEKGGRTTPWRYQDDKGEWHTTSGQKPQPFMRPALNDNKAAILRILKGGLSGD